MFFKCWGKNDSQADEEQERVLKANDRAYNAQFNYVDNYIVTSKYNILTFIPKNLFEQFQRLANFYFLVLMILQFIPSISSIAWYYTAIPLSIVLAFSAIKDAYDDIQRHRSDSQVNSRISYIVRKGKLVEEKWMNVKVGDIIRLENEHFITADLLLLSTSEPFGLCYIETAELDGETNLKTRTALPETAFLGDMVKAISNFDGEIVCEAPNNKLDRFDGKLIYNGVTTAISNDNMLLRGCRLKNTKWCYGVVIFAGKDSKLMKNSGKTTFKRTNLDRFLNILIMGIVLFLIALCLICTILCGVWEWVTGRYFTDYLEWDAKIIPNIAERGSRQIAILSFLQFFSYIILLNTVVPISLYVSVEILRFVHSLWINFDSEMYDSKTDTTAQARTTTLNEELGQVQYIFSDKTGTLTQNIMTFNKCSINGKAYGDVYDSRGEVMEVNEDTPLVDFSFNRWSEQSFKFYDKSLLDDTRKEIPEVEQFWRVLALCHTVMSEKKPGNQLSYQAQSPDEAALTSAARNFGFVFKSRTSQSITIEVKGKEETYDVLHLLDFNNVRKRMSIIVKPQKGGSLKLFCKGADTIILDMIKPSSNTSLKTSTMQHLDKFASDGLRTLCLASKDVEEEYCLEWLKRLKEANLDRQHKDERVDALYEEMEKDLTLIGATAIEDKLQDRVPETIANLMAANIKIWVLTGDKTETAINIGYSCKLLTEDMKEIFIIDGKTDDEVEVQLKDIRRRIDTFPTKKNPGNSAFYDNSSRGQNYEENIASYYSDNIGSTSKSSSHLPPQEGFALVINGHSLAHALLPKYERIFLEIGCLMVSVICCRVTPLQKALVVDLVKRNKKAITLSIGDGANDVSMIKTAHIGVGISGQEGMQAVLASDFSIAQFRFLQRLLLVHGRWSYYRMAKFLRYFFYKNFSFTLTHFWFSFFCGYSAQVVFDPLLITFYNLFFTSMPVLAMGCFDQDVNDHLSMSHPKLYMPGQYNLFFNMRIFIYSVFHGFASSLVLFFIPFGTFSMAIDRSGRDMNDYDLLTFTIFTSLVVVVTGQIMLDTAYWTWFTFIAIFGSIGFYFGLVIVMYEVLPVSWISNSNGIAFRAFATAQFWFTILLISVILLLPTMMNRFFWLDVRPSYADRLRSRRGTHKVAPKPIHRSSTFRRSHRQGSLRSGYAFSHSQGFGELIAKGKLFKEVKNLPPIYEDPPASISNDSSKSQSILSGAQNASDTSSRTPPPKPDVKPSKFENQDRSQSVMSTTHSFIVNQGDDPLPTSWSKESRDSVSDFSETASSTSEVSESFLM